MIDSNPFGAEGLESDPSLVVNYMYSTFVEPILSPNGPTQTPFPTKSIEEVPGLLEHIINHKQSRESVTEDHQVRFTTEIPDESFETELITYAVKKRTPGGFDRGGPFQQQVKGIRPILREERNDPADPDYKIVVFGKQFDNRICLTCWGRHSWEAEKRAIWLEKLIDEYTWWLTMQGLHRVLFMERTEDKVIDIRGNKLYGKPLDFYVKTERLTEVSRRKLEQLVMNVHVDTSEYI